MNKFKLNQTKLKYIFKDGLNKINFHIVIASNSL